MFSKTSLNRAGAAILMFALLSILVTPVAVFAQDDPAGPTAVIDAGAPGAPATSSHGKAWSIGALLAGLLAMGLTSMVPGSNINALTASGAVTPQTGLFPITKAGVAALTLVAPDVDGMEMVFVDEGGNAHTIVIAAVGSPPTAGLNGGGKTTATFNATKGSAVKLVSRSGSWWATSLTGVTLS